MRGVAALLLALLPATFALADRSESASPSRSVAVTFDDLPAVRGSVDDIVALNRRLLKALSDAEIRATGFVVAEKLIESGATREYREILTLWLGQGHLLGSHSYSHPSAHSVSLADYRTDVIRADEIIRPILEANGSTLRYYRHPLLHTGNTVELHGALREFLASRGYTTAPVTFDSDEYVFDLVYTRAKRAGDGESMERIASSYLGYMEQIFEHYERRSREVLGREPAQILLLHANEINSDHFSKLVGLLEQRGYTFVSLEQALEDPAYMLRDAVVPKGYSWIDRWGLAKGLEITEMPALPEWIAELAQQ
jgi:peptidoglycan/xylan/chitin deacetylase (PgdA/CDA1 family)